MNVYYSTPRRLSTNALTVYSKCEEERM